MSDIEEEKKRKKPHLIFGCPFSVSFLSYSSALFCVVVYCLYLAVLLVVIKDE